MHFLRTLAAMLALRTAGATAAHLFMAIVYAVSWADPRHAYLPSPTDLSQLVFFELLFIHSGVLLLFRKHMPAPFQWGLVAIYLIFGLALTTAMSTSWILLPFGWHLVSLIWGDVDPERRGGPFWYRYAGTVMIFLLATMLATWIPWPSFGWATVSGRYLADDAGGIIPPIGVIYFGGRALFELWLRWAMRSGTLDRLTHGLRRPESESREGAR